MIQELVAKGQDATALDGMSDSDIQALYAQVTGKQFKEPRPVSDPTPAQNAFAEEKAAIAKTKAEYDRINTELRAETKRAREQRDAARKDSVHAFCDKLVHEGRLLPAQRAEVEESLLAADDVDPCHKFKDGAPGGQGTAFEKKRRAFAAWPVVVKFGEKVKAGGAAGDEAAELAKVQTFAEAHTAALKAAGKTPAAYVHTFTEARKKDPTLTARKFGVPAEFCA
jgi:hypothetical protein